MTRELDIKVAEAMGFDVWPSEFDGRLLFDEAGVIIECLGRRVSRGPLPHYRTDYAALPEMPAWLRERGGVGITDQSSSLPDGWWCAWTVNFEKALDSFGDTLLEAVARLVVAIAEAQR